MRISLTGTNAAPKGNVRCKVVDVVDLFELAELTKRENWCPAWFKNDYRATKNFHSANVIGLDVDDFVDVEFAKKALTAAGYQYILAASKSHQKAKGSHPPRDRFRIIMPLAFPITTAQQFKLVMQQMFLQFPFIDTNATDPARFFFASPTILEVNTHGSKVTPVVDFGLLSNWSKKFIQTGEGLKDWNSTLYKVAKDFQEQGYSQLDFEKVLEEWTCVHTSVGEGDLNKSDTNTIERAFDGLPLHEKRGGSNENGITRDQALELAAQIIDPFFVQAVTDDATTYYRILDQELRTVTYMPNEDVLKRHILTHARGKCSAADAKRMLSVWREEGPAMTDTPAAYAWKDNKEYTFSKINMTLIEGIFPAWQQFLKRLSSPEVFMAFVWSLFEPQHIGRQLLWLYGPHGQDGKSAVLNVLSDPFGPAKAAINNNMMTSSGKQFLLASLFGKRVVVYPDCKDLTFAIKETTRGITSGDLQPIERKGKDAFSARVYARCMVASNYPPKISSSNADISRMILIHVDESPIKGDPVWIQQLSLELPQFLYACREAYRKLCPTHDIIELDEVTRSWVTQAHNIFEESYQISADELFEIDPVYECSAADFNTTIKDLPTYGFFREDFKRFLQTKYGVEIINRSGRIIYKGIKPLTKRGYQGKLAIGKDK